MTGSAGRTLTTGRLLLGLAVVLAALSLVLQGGGGTSPAGVLGSEPTRHDQLLPLVSRQVPPTATPTPTPTATPPPTQTPTPTPTPDLTPRVVLGSAPRLGIWTGSADQQAVDLLAASGARWTRVIIKWSALEPAYTDPPTYLFSTTDALLGRFARAGVVPLVEIRGNPTWAATTPCGEIDRAGGLAAFERFTRALAQRYAAAPYGVHHWELFNEADNTDVALGLQVGLGCWGSVPDRYAEMLRRVNASMRQADPDVRIVLGGLAQECIDAGCRTFNMGFLDGVLTALHAAGALDSLDVANVHYFSTFNPVWSQRGWDIAGKVQSVREVIAAHGVSQPVMVTELSWTSSGKGGWPGTDPRGSIPPALLESQARYVPKVLARGLAADVYVMHWFTLLDSTSLDYPYGLLYADRTPKPAYLAYQTAAREFGSAASVRPLAPAEVGLSTGVEGFAFRLAAGAETWVLWAHSPGAPDDAPSQVTVALPTGAAAALDKLGQPRALPGLLTDDPVYVRFWP